MNYKIKGCLVLMVVLSFAFVTNISAAMDVSLSFQGTGITNKTSGELLSSADLTVYVYDSMTGGNLIYSENFPGEIVNGSWNVMLGENSSNPLSLEFGEVYYQDIEVNGYDFNFTDYNGANVPRKYFYSPLGNINYTKNIFGAPADVDTVWDITGSEYLINSSGILTLNETKINESIDARSYGLGDNSSWNESFARTLFIVNESEVGLGENNLSANYGFFNFLGSITRRISGLFVIDLNVSGNASIGENLNVAGHIESNSLNSVTVNSSIVTSIDVNSANANVTQNISIGGNILLGAGKEIYNNGSEIIIEM